MARRRSGRTAPALGKIPHSSRCDVVDVLRRLQRQADQVRCGGIGARIDYLGKDGFPPLHIQPGRIMPARVEVRGDVSSQFLTALLMALPLAESDSTIEVQGELISKPYVEITLNVMRRFGIEVKRRGWQSFLVPAGAYVGEMAVIDGSRRSATVRARVPLPAPEGPTIAISWPGASSTGASPPRQTGLAARGLRVHAATFPLRPGAWCGSAIRPAVRSSANRASDARSVARSNSITRSQRRSVARQRRRTHACSVDCTTNVRPSASSAPTSWIASGGRPADESRNALLTEAGDALGSSALGSAVHVE